ncbi:hypothetical protein [Azotobacter armeniacus]
MERPVYCCGPPVAQHTISCHEVLESRRRDSMMGFAHARICIQGWVDHDSVDEVIRDSGDAIYIPKPLVKA